MASPITDYGKLKLHPRPGTGRPSDLNLAREFRIQGIPAVKTLFDIIGPRSSLAEEFREKPAAIIY